MKTFQLKRTSLVAVVAVAASLLIASHSTVSTVSAQVATDNTKKEMDTLIANIKKEMDRRQVVLNNSTGNTTATTTTQTNANVKDCGKDVPKSITDGAQKEAAKAGTDIKSIQDMLKNTKTLSEAKDKAKQADNNYQSFQITSTKSAVVGDLCTQAGSKDQLDQLLKQSKDQLASQQAAGQGTGNSEEQIKMLEQIIAAIGAIIASVVALLLAIATGDYAAIMAIFQTILGQLAVVANTIVQAISQLVKINISLGSGGA